MSQEVASGGDSISQDSLKMDSSEGSSSSPSKLLCGYLNKISGKGPLRGFKKRWFVFSPQECKLNFYRAKGDLVPLGDIDIRRATFTIHPVTGDQTSSLAFSIITQDQEYVLEGVDQKTTYFWIKELQRLRREYITNLSTSFGIKIPQSLDDSMTEPEVIEVKREERSMSTFYDELDENEEAILQAKKLMPKTEDSFLNKNRIRGGFTSSILTRVKNRAESLTRSNSNNINKASLSGSNCERCKDKEDQLVTISDDLTAVENELQATREVVHLLQRQLDITQSERDKLQAVIQSEGDSKSEALLSQISILETEGGDTKSSLANLKKQYERLTSDMEKMKEDRKKLKEENCLLKDIVEAKDKTVINLTNEIFELEANNGDPFQQNIQRQLSRHRSDTNDSMTFGTKVDTSEFDNLKDSVVAYKMQNEFLNQEIVAVNELRLVAEKKGQELQLKVYEWEAKCCQVQSKLLSLLKEINQSISQSEEKDKEGQTEGSSSVCEKKTPVIVNEATVDLVKRLLEDISLDIPLSWQKGNRSRLDPPTIIGSASKYPESPQYDDLGFTKTDNPFANRQRRGSDNTISDDEVDKDSKDGQESSMQIIQRSQSKVSAWQTRWDSFIGSLGNQELARSQELKFLLRHGVPREYRCKIWKGLINLKVKSQKERMGDGYYQRLLESKSLSKSPNTSYDPVVKQIELDLLRTLPNNRHFETLEADGTCRLRRVLTAYSRHNPKVGYCQGLNRLAAVSLLHMPEEDAFWSLVCIIEHLMPPEYYTQNLLGAHVDQYVFRDLLGEKLPKVHEVLEKLGIEISLFSWFLTCFVDNIPVDVYLRIWDIFLYEGNKVLFRFALAFFKLHEERILAAQDSVSINTLLRNLGETGVDVRSLCRIAFSFLNPFPINRIRQKRTFYTALVKSELERLDQIRKTLPSSMEEAKEAEEDDRESD